MNNQTNELNIITSKKALGLPLTERENALLTLYGKTDAAPADKKDASTEVVK